MKWEKGKEMAQLSAAEQCSYRALVLTGGGEVAR